jgi:hypothetical protein
MRGDTIRVTQRMTENLKGGEGDMATTKARSKVSDADEVENDLEDETTKPGVFRMSITIDPVHRRDIRIASAMRDMTPGEWAVNVLTKAAERELARGVNGEDE